MVLHQSIIPVDAFFADRESEAPGFSQLQSQKGSNVMPPGATGGKLM